MLHKQLAIELKRALSMDRILLWAVMIITPTLIQFFIIKDGYVFNNSIELFQRLISGFIPILFPIFMILIYTDSFINEKKHNYLTYTRTRIWLPTYLISKGIVNSMLAFLVSFLLVFLPFLFAIYIEPNSTIINYGTQTNNPVSKMTFNQFLTYGTLTYGIVYSLWVALNGMVYATLSFLLSLCIKNPFIALSIPFVWYQSMNFTTGILGFATFSPLSTIFPFNLTQQELWTILIPFTILVLVILGLILFLSKRQSSEWLD